MQYILWYIMIYLIIIMVLYVIEYIIPLKKGNLGTSKVYYFIVKRYKLKMDNKRMRLLTKIIVMVNSFILSLPIYMVIFIDIGYFLSLLISLIVFTVLILVLYNFVGYILKKKGW